jgi:predicted restriction endonuclease
VLAAAGHQCEAVEDGRRCVVRDGLEAHHVVPVSQGGPNTAENGRALCPRHHLLIEGRRPRVGGAR